MTVRPGPLKLWLKLWLHALLLVLLSACYAQTPPPATPTPPPAPAQPELPSERWSMIEPGGDTTCADGSSYAFYARDGSNNLVIDFQGGGACWNAATCSRPGAVYSTRLSPPPAGGGLYSRGRDDNPVADWAHVFIPYCTGDVHWGDNSASYDAVTGGKGGFTVLHRGAVNARAALAWVFEHFEAPERIFVTGCSAGAYGAILWTPLIREHYLQAEFYQLGDSGAGVVTETFVADSLRHWNVGGAIPTWVPGLEPSEDEVFGTDFVSRLYSAIGRHYQGVTLAQYHTLFDGVQIGFFELMGGRPEAWSAEMLRSLQTISAETGAFTSYLANYGADPRGATPHCILSRPEFYSLEAGGVVFVDWLAALLSGEDAPDVRVLE
ncbi:hypothetical protein BH24DEI1_BH24DEI1_20570 [soil metagenome]